MLKMYRCGEKTEEGYALLLGAFDGLHRGHCSLLERAKMAGLPVCITTIFGGKGSALFTEEEREFIFARMDIDSVYEIAFTEELKNTSPESFLSDLMDNIPVQAIYCGEDFRFGKDAAGTPELLKKIAPCPVEVVPLMLYDGKKVSASDCKFYLKAGEMEALNVLLATPYFIQGTVEHGREVGRTYGFPTLNLTVPAEKLSPKEGVYGGYAETPKGTYPAIINIGPCPTFGVKEKKLEAYLDGFVGDLYGETVRIYPTKFFRGIEKFASADALKKQLQKDIKRLQKNVP